MKHEYDQAKARLNYEVARLMYDCELVHSLVEKSCIHSGMKHSPDFMAAVKREVMIRCAN